MSFPFEIKDLSPELEKFGRKPVYEKGMTLLKYCKVRVKDINIKFYNFGREEGETDSVEVKKLVAVFKNGEYEGEYREPPVVTPDGKLVTGKHRFLAAIIAKEEWIIVAICEFANTKILKMYAAAENLREEVKNTLKLKDIVYNTVCAINDNEVNKTKNSIREYLRAIGWKESLESTVEDILSKVDENFKQKSEPSRELIAEMVLEDFGVDVSTAPSWLVATLRGGDNAESTTRYARLRKKLVPMLIKGKDMNVVVGLSKTSSKDIPTTRKFVKDNFCKDIVEEALAIASALGWVEGPDAKNNLGTINFMFVSQIEGEEGNFVEIE